MELAVLNTELKAIQVRLEYLAQAINELKVQNEDRRVSIDALATAIRSENRHCAEQCHGTMESLKEDVERLKTEIGITRWVGIILGGTALSLTAYKILSAEPLDHDPKIKPTIERLIGG